MQNVVGFGLAAGRGVRLQPLTIKASGYIRSKAVVRFLGERIITWIVRQLRDQGLHDVIMITRGKENRCQVKSVVEYGDRIGMQIQYSPVELGDTDTGSAGALLDNLACRPEMPQTLFVFPTDSLIEFTLPDMLAVHQRSGAAVTIAAAEYPAETIAGTYGLLDTDTDGRVRNFLEKPSLETIYAHYHTNDSSRALPLLKTSAGFYLMDPEALRQVARHPVIAKRKSRLLDIGSDLLPWMVAHGYPIQAYTVTRMGDMGNIPSYLATMVDMMSGAFPSLLPYLEVTTSDPQIYIDPTSWLMPDIQTGLSLRDKVEHGLVTLRPPVRIGKYVRIHPHTILSSCNIDDECVIQEHAVIERSSVGEGTVVGKYCRLTDAVVGMMVSLHSSARRPVVLSDFAAVGDEVTLNGGVALRGRITVFPRLSIPSAVQLDTPMDLTSIDVLPGVISASTPPRMEKARDSEALLGCLTPYEMSHTPGAIPAIQPARNRAML